MNHRLFCVSKWGKSNKTIFLFRACSFCYRWVFLSKNLLKFAQSCKLVDNLDFENDESVAWRWDFHLVEWKSFSVSLQGWNFQKAFPWRRHVRSSQPKLNCKLDHIWEMRQSSILFTKLDRTQRQGL